MIQAPELPLWAAIVVSLLILSGASLTLIGVIGLTRLKTFYERVHAPTLGATLGGVLICAGSMLCFAVLQTRVIAHEILLVGFVLITTPVTLILLVRAALYRDRAEDNPHVPPME
ncbi:MAG: monovalent cation/H(+) antiporter subunit G [Asticcacaulis sp.]|uniref:monovalent cation/H(+) antiporter subunit G n=1 Tax=Asticcacaulis tiandongensis TaxID=2565365 RepID=UPI00112D7C49|nr:monovalent cation/H(+) antiporter subunit G [Asticcacaulis tiandongensis]